MTEVGTWKLPQEASGGGGGGGSAVSYYEAGQRKAGRRTGVSGHPESKDLCHGPCVRDEFGLNLVSNYIHVTDYPELFGVWL